MVKILLHDVVVLTENYNVLYFLWPTFHTEGAKHITEK